MNARDASTAGIWLQTALSSGEKLADCLAALETRYGGEVFQRSNGRVVEVCHEDNSGHVTVIHTLQQIGH